MVSLALCAFLERHPTKVKHLVLASNSIGADGVAVLLRLLPILTMMSVDLADNPVGDDIAVSPGLAAVIAGSASSLKVLNLSGCKLTDAFAATVAPLLACGAWKGKLVLDYNKFNGGAFRQLCDAFGQGALRELSLLKAGDIPDEVKADMRDRDWGKGKSIKF